MIPSVSIEEPSINFGTVSAQSTATHPLTFTNKSPHKLFLVIDLSNVSTGIELLDIVEQTDSMSEKTLARKEDRIRIDINPS